MANPNNQNIGQLLKNKDKKKIEEAAEILSKVKNQKREEEDPEDVRTPAQIAYDKIQEKRVSIQYNETHTVTHGI